MDAAVANVAAEAEVPAQRLELPPSEALGRFVPPEGFVPVAAGRAAKTARYGFRTAGLALLIRQGIGSEVVPMMPLAAIPNGPPWLLGMINLRGNLVPVCDLRRVLGRGSESGSAKSMILVLDKGEKAAGFVIEGYPVALADLRPAGHVSGLPDSLARHVPSAQATDEEVWLEFDHEGYLDESARQ